jgi:2-iminoacetate synthase
MYDIDNVKRLIFKESSDSDIESLAHEAHELTVRRFGKTIKLYAPVYLSNSCINACRYCGFNEKSNIKRTTLSTEEAAKEIDHLISQGHRHILLVCGEDPRAVSVNYLENIAKKIRGRVARLTIETQPFDEVSYKRLADAGVDGVTLYQETYHRPTYEEMHPSGPKSDFNLRLQAMEAAGRAGMRFLGIGALLGLYDWRFEAVSLIRHARELKKKFWQSSIAVSFPRIRDCASSFTMPCPVSDKDLVKMIILLRLALPDADLVISTREPQSLRDHLIPLGITQMSAGSVTSPGGYTKKENAGEQFHIEDTRPATEFADNVASKGYQPVWKDWI